MEKEEEVVRVMSMDEKIYAAMQQNAAALSRIDEQQVAIKAQGAAIASAFERLTAQEEKNARSEERLAQIEKRSEVMEDKLAQSEIRLGEIVSQQIESKVEELETTIRAEIEDSTDISSRLIANSEQVFNEKMSNLEVKIENSVTRQIGVLKSIVDSQFENSGDERTRIQEARSATETSLDEQLSQMRDQYDKWKGGTDASLSKASHDASERVREQNMKHDALKLDLSKLQVATQVDHQQIKQEILQVKLDYEELRESVQGQSFRRLEEESGSSKSLGNSVALSRTPVEALSHGGNITPAIKTAERDIQLSTDQGSDEGEQAVSSDAADSVPPGFAPFTPRVKGPVFCPDALTADEVRREALAATPGGFNFLAPKISAGGGGKRLAFADEVRQPKAAAAGPLKFMGMDLVRPASQRNASVVVNITPVTENERLRHPFIYRTIKKWLEVFKKYKRISVDASYNLVDFLTEPVQRLLIADTRRKKYMGLQIDELNFVDIATDELVFAMLMEFMRPQSSQEYETAMYESVTRFPKVVKDFSILDYDNNIARTIDAIVGDVLFIDACMRHNITPEQERTLPQVKWGDPGGIDRGVIQIATACLRPYVGNFKSMIAAKFGEKALKNLTDLKTWAQRVTDINDECTQDAIAFRRSNLRATPGERVETIQNHVDESRTRQHFVAGRGEKRFPEERRRGGPENLGRIEYVQQPSQTAWGPHPV